MLEILLSSVLVIGFLVGLGRLLTWVREREFDARTPAAWISEEGLVFRGRLYEFDEERCWLERVSLIGQRAVHFSFQERAFSDRQAGNPKSVKTVHVQE